MQPLYTTLSLNKISVIHVGKNKVSKFYPLLHLLFDRSEARMSSFECSKVGPSKEQSSYKRLIAMIWPWPSVT